MSDIHIERNHALGLAAARAVARQWMRKVEQDYGIECSYEEGDTRDIGQFTRAGIDGTVEVSGSRITLNATLGFMFASFSEQIEQRLLQNLDESLGEKSPAEDDDDAYNDKDWR